MLNDEIESDSETTSCPRSYSIQLPVVERPSTPGRQQTDPSTYRTRSFWPVREESVSLPYPTNAERQTPVRAPRLRYEDEQVFFIWYHRTDLGLGWDEVLRRYHNKFHQKRQKTGLQCKFYRLLECWGVEKVRAQARSGQGNSSDRVGAYGVIQRTWRRFQWMRSEDLERPPLLQFRDRGHSPINGARTICPGCSDCRQQTRRRTDT